MELKKNMDIELEITGTTHDGSGVGRAYDFVLFVPGTSEGDLVRARVLSVKKRLAYAKLLEVVRPSPARVEPDCPVFLRCGGCAFRHIAYAEELRIKRRRVADALKKIGGLGLEPEPVLESPETEGYRNKAQYPVGPAFSPAAEKAPDPAKAAKRVPDRTWRAAGAGQSVHVKQVSGVTAGFYAPHSHRIVGCTSCRLQPPVFEALLKAVLSWMKEFSVPPYDEQTGKGLVRHVFIRRAPATGETVVCLVINGGSCPGKDELVAALKAVLPDLKGVVININRERTNVILGRECATIYGSDRITDALGGVKYEISPLSFYQVNSAQTARLYALAEEFAGLRGDEMLLDMYCGAGTIGLFMANKVREVIGVEVVPEAVEDAKRNAEINGIKNARFICADAGKAAKRLLSEGCRPDVVVLDPPRKGCDAATIEAVVSMSPSRIVYVSCDPATLARDLKIFSEKGYLCGRVKPVDMFPRTPHVECCCLLELSSKE